MLDKYLGDNESNWSFLEWGSLAAKARFYPENPTEQQQQEMRKHIETLRVALPCEECRSNVVEELSRTNIDYSSREALQRSIYKLQCAVRTRLGKYNLSFEEAMEQQEWIRKFRWNDFWQDTFREHKQNQEFAQASEQAVEQDHAVRETERSVEMGTPNGDLVTGIGLGVVGAVGVVGLCWVSYDWWLDNTSKNRSSNK